MTLRRGIAFLTVSVVGLALVFGVSAAVAGDVELVQERPDRDLVIGLQGTGSQGHLSVYRDGERTTFRSNAPSYHDVTWVAEDRVLAAFIVNSDECERYDKRCAETGFRVVNTTTDTIIREWTFEVRSVPNSEVHDVEPLGDGRYVLADMDRERLVIVDAEGEIEWQWFASEFYTPPDDPTRRDWLHINDVDVIGDGRFLVSVRNANQLLVVERGKGVTDVVNEGAGTASRSCTRDGELVDGDDVHCGDPDVMLHQHNPQRLANGAILVADSENNRIVELHEQKGSWTVARAMYEAGGEAFRWPRDADRLPNGHTLVTDSRNNRVLEVAPNGTVIWQQRTAPLPYDAELRGAGEEPEGAVLPAEAHTAPTGQLSVPLLDKALIGLQHVVAVPYWVTSWHLLAVLVGLIGIVEGLAQTLKAIADRRGAGREAAAVGAESTDEP
jgi:hypothetical protein